MSPNSYVRHHLTNAVHDSYANGSPSLLLTSAVGDDVDPSAAVAIAARRMVRIPSKVSYCSIDTLLDFSQS